MRDIYILGVGQTPVTKETALSVRRLAADAVKAAMADAGAKHVERPVRWQHVVRHPEPAAAFGRAGG